MRCFVVSENESLSLARTMVQQAYALRSNETTKAFIYLSRNMINALISFSSFFSFVCVCVCVEFNKPSSLPEYKFSVHFLVIA